MKKAKIVATIGPASSKPAVMERMVKAGMDVCRLNFSYGTHEEHRKQIATIRRLSRQTGRAIAIMQDLQGPKIRVGKLKHPIEVKKGDELILTGRSDHKQELTIPTTYKNIASDSETGKTILMADGKIILNVKEVDKRRKQVHCQVINGGAILTGKGINLPYTHISLPALTPKDRDDAIFGAAAGVDYMALSFVRSAADVLKLRRLLKRQKADIPIVAKLEKPEAVDNLDEILDVVDGVMVARGDLAVELSFSKVPIAQKRILHEANRRGKITLIATEMLGSMVDNPLPTRAEASDVANGILDCADAVMLSNESATGKFPVKSIRAMADIVKETESGFGEEHFHRILDLPEAHELIEAMCESAAHLSYSLNERAVVVLTSSGETARILSKYRPQSTIYAVTMDEKVYAKMAFYNNVLPILLKTRGTFDSEENVHRLYHAVEKELHDRRLVKKGDKLIILTGIVGKKKNVSLDAIHVRTV